MCSPRVPRRVQQLAAAAVGMVVLAGAVAVPGEAAPRVRVVAQPLLSAGVAVDAQGQVHEVPALDAAEQRFVAGSSVLATRPTSSVASVLRRPDPQPADAGARVEADRAWLAAGTVPGQGSDFGPMAQRALLDLRALTTDQGASAAAWRPYWRAVWPRDASWVAAAFAATGHPKDALAVLGFLGRAQRDDGTWAARYRLDGAPVRDGRPDQLDATGWVPWAVWFVHAITGAEVAGLWDVVRRSADAAAVSLQPDGLPRASQDYWENSTDERTLDTAAALRAGLRAAVALARERGADVESRRWTAASRRLERGLARTFAPRGYPRTARGGADAAVAFLAPPFGDADARVRLAIATSAARLAGPNGGLLPGTRWSGAASVTWTPQTAAMALAEVTTGQRSLAVVRLHWLDDHRTALGALPEKVDGFGRPASVAPLAWTAASTLLALHALDAPLPTPPAV